MPAINVWEVATPAAIVGALRQVIVATAGQTVFPITLFTYTVGINSLNVYINGVKQYINDSYTETTNSSVTFSEGLDAGDKVLFEVNGG